MSVIPLRYRLPNPPAVFVGREREVAWIADAIRRGPITVVVGPGGLGKTALVLAALHRKLKKRLQRTLFVALGPSISGPEIGQEVLRALAEAEKIEGIDWPALAGDSDALVEAILDLAESGPWWVVLDDVHHGDPDEARRLLQKLGRYARDSKWIATSRMDPRIDSALVLTLGGMPPDELASLAREWGDVDEDALSRALHVSGGSPWLLQQCLASGRSEPAVTRDSLLAELPDDARELLEALCVVSAALPPEVVATFVDLPPPDRITALERRGLIEVSPAGIRLHDVVRSVLRAPGASGASSRWCERAARALGAQPDPEQKIDALRLFLELGFFADAALVLDAGGDALLTDGYALRLWRLIEPVSDDRLARWRLRCAANLGNPTILGKVREPESGDAADRVAWAQTLYMQGQLAQASELALELWTDPDVASSPELATAAGLLAARCLAQIGERGRALRQLEQLPAHEPDEVALRDLEIATCLAGTPQGADAIRIVDVLRTGLAELSSQVRDEVAAGIANVYRVQGRLSDATELLRAVRSTARGGALSLFLARRAHWLEADVAVMRGELVSAERALEELAPFVRSASLIRPEIAATRAALRLARGDVEGLDAQLGDTEREAALFGARATCLRAQALRVELATLEGRVVDVDPPDVTSKEADVLRARIAAQRARHGQDVPLDELSRIASTHDSDLGPLVRITLARSAALRAVGTGTSSGAAADADMAVREAVTAVREAATGGHAVREAEAREASCEVLVLAGRTAELAARAEELATLAARLGSARFARSAELWQQAARDRPRWATLEQLALERHVAPVTARRAQLFLGGSPAYDALDHAIVTRLRASPAWAPPELLDSAESASPWTAGWGLDEPLRSAWLPDGSAVDFTRRALHWRLLHALADDGGRATKERLVLTVWNEPEYHPLKHDARLQVAIRKLRELLENDPGAPTRIVTTPDGYALTGPLRRATR